MRLEIKFFRHRTPVTIGSYLNEWWVTKGKMTFAAMGVEVTA